jgi:hypothetical protein
MTHRSTSTLSRLITAEIDAVEKLHDFKLDPKDRLLLADSLTHYLVRDIDKFVRGAKHHVEPLIDRVRLLDIEDELIDARFYSFAIAKRLNNFSA